jgi:hypothetical protein
MTADLHISFRGMDPSPAAEAQMRRRADERGQFSDRISRMIFNGFALTFFEPQTKRELRVSDRIRPCV